MQLKTLDIKGFKSFPDKTSIHFNENITGVVGPNGSGKSNIVDAIRWVLGEQKTKNLRSEKMDNLIFNGAKGRRASGLAEVSLTFENTRGIIPSEFKDITVTRILHRSGESEYRINNVTCRLKDITNLFLDTGVGSDSYAIMELRMIDEILNDRDNSRRRLFEQAAGISKYKQRKKETLNKLSATDADLDRVEDLLFEINNNLKTLESQARKAKRYQKLKEDYKKFSVELAKMQIADYQESFQAIEKQKKEQEDKKLELETKVDQLEAKLEKGKTELIEKEKSLTARQKELNELISSINKKENEKNIGAEQVKFLKEKQDNLEQQLKNSKEQIDRLELKSKELATKEQEQEQAAAKIKKEVEEKQQSVEKIRERNDALKAEVDESQQKRQELERKIHDLEKSLAIQSTEKENLQRAISQNKTENLEREEHLTKLKKELQGLEKQRDEKNKALEKLKEEEVALQEKIGKAEQQLKETEQQLSEQNRKLDAKQHEYDLNKSLVDNLEGFPESIKFLKKNPKTKEAQLLSDIIFCKEQYRTAIENYLEPYLNYFVVNDLDEALSAVDLLHDAAKGRANFFILKEFDAYKTKTPEILPNATPALQVIEVDEKYKRLAAFLLKNVYIVKENALQDDKIFEQVESKDKDVYTFLSASGKYVRNNFSLSGGALGLFEGMRLGRAKTMEKLKEDIEQLEKERKTTEKKIKELGKQIAEWKEASNQPDMQTVGEEINQLNNQVVSVQTKIENYQSFLDKNESKNTDIETRIKELEEQGKQQEKDLKEFTAEKEKFDKSYEELQENYNEVHQKLTSATNEYNEQNIVFHQQQNLLNSVQQESQYVKDQLEEQQQRIKDYKEEQEQSTVKQEEQDQRLKELEQELMEVYEEKEQFEKSLSDVETNYYKVRGDINELEEQLKGQSKSKNQVEVVINEIKDKMTELKIELNGMKERLAAEFNININDIIDESPEEGLDEEETREKVEKIKRRLENFGEINPMAVEAYEEMKKRHDFISSQKEDLLEAKESLMETIEEIETTAKEKFLESFDKVRDNFIMIFRSLFSEEDTCDLYLTDPDNPLDASIEIIAKPKGKKPQHINQLSGGEKSLTSLAILFALYLLKPAPFCILDEVDAPLDDTNIGKFNKTIRKFSEESQFILVTHNKETMAAVDIIYGVTMAESGVSRVVSVDFRNLN